jgi:hypothetical protein
MNKRVDVLLTTLFAILGAAMIVLTQPVLAQSQAWSLRNGTSDPATCRPNSLNAFFNTTSGALKLCTALNTWSTIGGSGANPAGSGSEVQYRAGATSFGALTGSSVSGANITLGGTLTIPIGTLKLLDAAGDGFGFSPTHHGPLFFNSAAGNAYGVDSSGLTAARTYTAPDQNGTYTVLGNSNLATSVTGTAANVTGTVAVGNGGTGLTTLTANNVILGNGASTPSFVAPGSSGNVLTSNGTTWASTAPAAAGGAPFSDATAIVSNSSDVTKLFKLSASGIATGTTFTLFGRPSGIGIGTATTADATADSLFAASATTQTPFGVQGAPSQTVDLFYAATSSGARKHVITPGGSMMLAQDVTFCFYDSGTSIASNATCSSNGLNVFKYNSAVIEFPETYKFTKNTALQMGQTSGTAISMLSDTPAINWQSAGLKPVSGKPIISFTDTSTGTAWITQAGDARVTTQFDATTTTLANITGLVTTRNLEAGRTYAFEAVLHVAADTVGGEKFAVAGTATATAIIYQVTSIADTSNANAITSRQTALGGSVGTAGDTAYFTEIKGTITVNAAGTLAIQFAQNAANGTSSILVGSVLRVRDTT